LDECSTGLDPESRRTLWTLIEDVKKRTVTLPDGRVVNPTILLNTHSLEEAEALADRICIMDEGIIKALGTAQEIKSEHGTGYRVTVIAAGDSDEQMDEAEEVVEKAVKRKIMLVDQMFTTMIYAAPSKGVSLGSVASSLEQAQKRGKIDDWTVSTVSLEEIFLSLAEIAKYTESRISGCHALEYSLFLRLDAPTIHYDLPDKSNESSKKDHDSSESPIVKTKKSIMEQFEARLRLKISDTDASALDSSESKTHEIKKFYAFTQKPKDDSYERFWGIQPSREDIVKSLMIPEEDLFTVAEMNDVLGDLARKHDTINASVVHHNSSVYELDCLKSQKSELEISCIRRAGKISTDAFKKTLEFIQPHRVVQRYSSGNEKKKSLSLQQKSSTVPQFSNYLLKERDISSRLEYEMLRRGAQYVAFPSVIACGENSKTIHHVFGDSHLKGGEMLLCDFGCAEPDYLYVCDITRTIPLPNFGAETGRSVLEQFNQKYHPSPKDRALLDNSFLKMPPSHSPVGPVLPDVEKSVLHTVDRVRNEKQRKKDLEKAWKRFSTYSGKDRQQAQTRFSPPQRRLYESVLEARKNIFRSVNRSLAEGRPLTLSRINQYCYHSLTLSLMPVLPGMRSALDIFKNPSQKISAKDIKEFLPHSVVHHVGLNDVHDCTLLSPHDELPLRSVLAIEPALYFPIERTDIKDEYRGLGIRLEDTIALRRDGIEILTDGFPVEIDAVEQVVNECYERGRIDWEGDDDEDVFVIT
ncbi:hypothetical protein ADUPG1_010158, partial [Aduncisulcus paluster]